MRRSIFIGESMKRFELITKGSDVVISPVAVEPSAGAPRLIRRNTLKCRCRRRNGRGGVGFYLECANDYSKPYAAMPEIRMVWGSISKGDELPRIAQAGLNPIPDASGKTARH